MAIVVVIMAVTQGGAGYFVQFGPDKVEALALARDVIGPDVPVPLADGHDGVYFWAIARDPLLRGDVAPLLDRPTYRAQRIGYPALAAPWHLGGEQALLWGLVVTNLAVVAAGTWLTAALAQRLGARPELGYLFLANPLVFVAVLFDFADALALLGLVGAVWAVVARRPGVASGFAVVAALARESSLLGLGALAVLVPGLRWQARAVIVTPAVAAAVAWRAYMTSRPGFGQDPEIQEFSFVPFEGFVESWRDHWSTAGRYDHAAVALALIPLAGLVVYAWFRDRRSPALIAALPFALFIPFLAQPVLTIWVNAIRAFGPAVTLAGVAVLAARSARPRSSASLGPHGATGG
jgi:hypothetical protein